MKEIIMDLIIHSGEARSYAMEAIQLAKAGDVEGARSLIEKASIQLGKAHKSQTALIQDEASENKIEISMLLIHAQDQLMTTMTLKDLANEIIDLYEKLNQKIFSNDINFIFYYVKSNKKILYKKKHLNYC